jgi:hypothetical protein
MLLYKAVEEKLKGNGYENIFYQTMREDKVGDVGIYLYESANDLEDMCGEEVYNCVKVHVQVNAGQNVEEMEKALNFLSSFVERIENEISDIDGIEFISVNHVGPRALPIGKNNYNILICRSLIDLKYTFDTNSIRL